MQALRVHLVAAAALLAAIAAPAPADAASPYAPYEWLIGEWNIGPDGESPTIVERFRWGPKESYIWATTSILQEDKSEHLHFEGILVWNGAARNIDYLFVVEPGSLAQERGVFRRESGRIVRDVVLTGADGKMGEFRQTFEWTGPDTAITTVMRKTAEGWEPTFPGSDRLLMRKRR